MKRTVSLILALILCLGALPLGALAMDISPVLWEMHLYRKGAEMQFEMEYGFDSSFDFVELYMLGDKAKDGDLKGPLGLMDIGGEIYHLLGIQTIGGLFALIQCEQLVRMGIGFARYKQGKWCRNLTTETQKRA